MFTASRLLLIVFLDFLLCSCFGGVQPTVHNLESEKSDDLRMKNIILTRRVVLERGEKTVEIYHSERSIDETASSKFGREDEFTNVDCIVAGLRNVMKNSMIVTPAEFWEGVGVDTEALNLTSLFNEPYSRTATILDLDYIIVAYHQLFDAESIFWEDYITGMIGDRNIETAATVTVDMKEKRVIDATRVDGIHTKAVGHGGLFIPFAIFTYPEESPCQLAGKHAGEAITQSLTTNKIPRIAVVAAEKNPHSILSVPAHVTDKASRIKPEIETYCPDADSGQADAQKHIGDLFYLGTHGIKRDLIRAYVWYSLAATGGNIEATRQLYPLIDELFPDQSDEAVRQLLDWEPGQCERDLNNAIFEGNE